MHLNFDPADPEAGLKLLEDLTTNVDHIQQQVLKEVLTRNANTEYLKNFLDGQSDKELFKKKVPILDYENIQPYIARVANGEPSEVAENIPQLIISSSNFRGKTQANSFDR